MPSLFVYNKYTVKVHYSHTCRPTTMITASMLTWHSGKHIILEKVDEDEMHSGKHIILEKVDEDETFYSYYHLVICYIMFIEHSVPKCTIRSLTITQNLEQR